MVVIFHKYVRYYVLTNECGGIQIVLRFEYINVDKYKPYRDERNKWVAIHIEVDKEERKQAAC